MKRTTALALVIALIVNLITGFSALADEKKGTTLHDQFIIDSGISEAEYNIKKSEFVREAITNEYKGVGRYSLFAAQDRSGLSSKSLSGNLLSNEYVEFAVNPENGRFTIGTVAGNPDISSDDHKILLYGHSNPSTSYTTVCVNGTPYIYGNSGFLTDPHFDGNSNISEVSFDGFQVKQEISIVRNSSTQREDIVEVKYTARNTSASSRSFGLRIMLDTMLGNNDAAPFRVPGYGDLSTEKEFSGDEIPQYWQAFDSLTSPNVVSYGNFVSGAITPNKVQFSNWRRVYNKPWDYHVSTGTSNGDSAVSIIWERTLAAGTEETYVTRYGLSELLQDMQPPLALTIASGSSVLTNAANDGYLPYTITAYVQNVGEATAQNVILNIDLPTELVFADESETGIVRLGALAVGQIATIEKVVNVKERHTKDIITQYRVRVSADNAATKSLIRDLNISEVEYAKKGTFKFITDFNDNRDATGTYYYSDAYFEGNSLTPNPHLATMSLCLEMAAWGSNEVGKGKDSWPKRTKNVQALLEEIGFSGFKQNDAWNDKPSMNSIGAVTAFKNIDADTTIVAVAVRGGGYFDEWGGNFNLGSSGNHRGFQTAADKVKEFISKYVSDNKSKFGHTLKLWIVGYSRGGATANMVAGQLIDAGSCGGMSLLKQNIYAYTFEAPRGYIGSDPDKYRVIHNYVNPMDIVPLVAPAVWNFNRYNRVSEDILKWLGTKTFSDRVSAINTQYKEVLKGVPIEGRTDDNKKKIAKNSTFDPNPYATIIDINLVDTDTKSFRFLLWDIPYVSIEWNPYWYRRDTSKPVDSMLNGSFNSIFGNLPGGRTGYVDNVQNALTHLTSFFLGYDNNIDWSSVIYDAFFENYAEGARGTIGVIINPLRPVSQKVKDAAKYAARRIADSALKQTGTNLSEVETALVNLLVAVFGACVDDIQQFFGLLYYVVSDNGIQHHFSEVTLAALMTYDSYYVGSNAFKHDYPQSYRIVQFNCPVDITVKNDDGSTLSKIVGDVVTNSNSIHGAGITEDGTKQVVLPSDAAYNIDIHATDGGEMSVSIFEYNSTLQEYTLLQGYQNISIQKGEDYRLIVPEFIQQDYVDLEGDGSVSPYRLLGPSSESLEPTLRKTGDDIVYHHISLSADNQKGIVTGGGDFVESSFAEIHAKPLPTVEFIGWYIGNEQVSSDPDYRFAVDRDIEVVAHFTEGNFNKLTLKATVGGQVNFSEIELPEGQEIELIAKPDEGYRFVRWEANAGTLENLLANDTMFTMPAGAAIVSALFADNSVSITQQPSDQFVAVGQRATFTVIADGEGLRYQWYINRNGGKGWVPINGAIGYEYTTAVVDLSNDGYQYFCLITDATGNTIQTEIATLHVQDPGEIPETGDSSRPDIWLIILMVGMIGLVFQWRRKIFL